jgi:hypothetical protein
VENPVENKRLDDVDEKSQQQPTSNRLDPHLASPCLTIFQLPETKKRFGCGGKVPRPENSSKRKLQFPSFLESLLITVSCVDQLK